MMRPVRGSARSWGWGLLVAWVAVLAPGAVRGDSFEGWTRFATRQGKPEVQEAVEFLHYREPALLLSPHFWELATHRQETGVRKRIELLRLDRYLQDSRLMAVVDTLGGLPGADQQAMRDLRKPGTPTAREEARGKEVVAGLVERGALFLEVDLEQLGDLFRLQALECWQLQKTLQAALQSYPAKTSRPALKQLDRVAFADLRKAGLLPDPFRDPGYRDGSEQHFVLLPGGKVFCTHHGSSEPPGQASAEHSIRQQLELLGEKDEALLDRCADLPLVPKVLRGGPEILR